MSDQLEREDQLHEKISQVIFDAAPVGWVYLDTTYQCVGSMGEMKTLATLDDGTVISVGGIFRHSAYLLKELRREMYKPGIGTWFSVSIRVRTDESSVLFFNYDKEPIWSYPIVPGSYEEDLQLFPRDEKHQPTWLKEKLGK